MTELTLATAQHPLSMQYDIAEGIYRRDALGTILNSSVLKDIPLHRNDAGNK
ncbi:MAG: hypothetical protein HRU20_06110 [Pseudomonadales bacterium]|nr:hypothetical protein [Pseudomonadales bacterium]